jgi:hypothetical protein
MDNLEISRVDKVRETDFELLIMNLDEEIGRYRILRNSIGGCVDKIKSRKTQECELATVKSEGGQPTIIDKLTIQLHILRNINDEMGEISEHLQTIV